MRIAVVVVAAGVALSTLAGCGDEDAASPARPSATAAPVTSCEDYQGDALTDPCAPLDAPGPAVPAACTRESFDAAVASEIDGGLRVGDSACDADHLILDFFVDACPPTDGEPVPSGCRRTERAYFLRDGDRWALVTYGDGMTCEAVRAETGRVFPDSLCAQLPAPAGP